VPKPWPMQLALRQKSYASSTAYAACVYAIAPGANAVNRDAWPHNPCSLRAETIIFETKQDALSWPTEARYSSWASDGRENER
jgi:hypothetical protein